MLNNIDPALEQQALREHGILGRAGPYGNSLFAFEYDLLPPEAKQVLELIAHSGPLRHPEHDGNLYGNRSGDLPGRNQYREFTVPTPGATHRGERRLVIRDNGLVFLTACHYERIPGKTGTQKHAESIDVVDEHWRNGFYLVTGMSPSLRQKVAAGIKRIHNARLPVPRGGA